MTLSRKESLTSNRAKLSAVLMLRLLEYKKLAVLSRSMRLANCLEKDLTELFMPVWKMGLKLNAQLNLSREKKITTN